MSINYMGSYIKITKGDLDKVAQLLEHAKGVGPLAHWLETNEETINRWTTGETKKWRSEALDRVELLHKECCSVPMETAAAPSELRAVFDSLVSATKRLPSEHRNELRDISRTLACIILERGEA